MYMLSMSVVGSPHIREDLLCNGKEIAYYMIKEFQKQHNGKYVLFSLRPWTEEEE